MCMSMKSTLLNFPPVRLGYILYIHAAASAKILLLSIARLLLLIFSIFMYRIISNFDVFYKYSKRPVCFILFYNIYYTE